jgi:hypothetical protein
MMRKLYCYETTRIATKGHTGNALSSPQDPCPYKLRSSTTGAAAPGSKLGGLLEARCIMTIMGTWMKL